MTMLLSSLHSIAFAIPLPFVEPVKSPPRSLQAQSGLVQGPVSRLHGGMSKIQNVYIGFEKITSNPREMSQSNKTSHFFPDSDMNVHDPYLLIVRFTPCTRCTQVPMPHANDNSGIDYKQLAQYIVQVVLWEDEIWGIHSGRRHLVHFQNEYQHPYLQLAFGVQFEIRDTEPGATLCPSHSPCHAQALFGEDNEENGIVLQLFEHLVSIPSNIWDTYYPLVDVRRIISEGEYWGENTPNGLWCGTPPLAAASHSPHGGHL